MSAGTGTTTAAERFGVVMSWIQAIAIIVGLSVSFLLFVIAAYEGWEGDYLLIAAIWGLGGCLFGFLLAAIAYIVSGRFSILPLSHLQLTKKLIVGTPLAVALAAFIVLEANKETHTYEDAGTGNYFDRFDEVEAEETLNEEEETWYEETALGESRSGYTNKETGEYLIIDTDPEGSGLWFIAAGVIDDWLITSAVWQTSCQPEASLSNRVKCSGDGEYAYSTRKIKSPDWEDYDEMRWKMDEAGFVVDEKLSWWPLDKARQIDAGLNSKGVRRPDPEQVEHILWTVRGDD